MALPDDAPNVQPDTSGQGEGGTPDTPYAEYLNRIPEEVRSQVEPIFKEWDSNVTRRFQDASEFRQQWEPYQPLGVTDLSPDEVAWALQFRQAAVNNPDAIRQWYDEYAQTHGLAAANAAVEQAQTQQSGEFDYVDPNLAALKEQLSPMQQQLEQINAWRMQQEQAARVQEAERFISHQMDELKTKHPDEFNQAAVERLLPQYIETDPQHAVQRAFADWQSIRAQIERDTLQSKVNAPPPAESGGAANSAPEQIRTMADASRFALEQLRAANHQG